MKGVLMVVAGSGLVLGLSCVPTPGAMRGEAYEVTAAERGAALDLSDLRVGRGWSYRRTLEVAGQTSLSLVEQRVASTDGVEAHVSTTTTANGKPAREEQVWDLRDPAGLAQSVAPESALAREEVAVPGGTYAAIAFRTEGAGGSAKAWYVPGVGLVKQVWTTTTPAGTTTDTLELLAYQP